MKNWILIISALCLWVLGSIIISGILFYQSPEHPQSATTSTLGGVLAAVCLLTAFYLSYKYMPGKAFAVITLAVGIYIEIACSAHLLKSKKMAAETIADVSRKISPPFFNLILAYSMATILFFAGLIMIVKYFRMKPSEKI